MARKTGKDAFRAWVESMGGSIAASRKLSIGDSMVRHVCNGNRPLAPQTAKEVEQASGGEYTREQLLPELFGPIKTSRRKG